MKQKTIEFFILYHLIIFISSIKFLNADPTINNQVTTTKPESFEEIGVKILNALIKFGKMELTKAQIKLLRNGNPEQNKLFEQIPLEEMALGDLLQRVNKPPLNDNWITVEKNENKLNKNSNEQVASFVMDKVQKQIIPDIVKKLVNKPSEIRPTMTSPEEKQRLKHLEHERIFHQVINEQDTAEIVQPLRLDIRSQISPLPPDKKYKIDESTIRPSFHLRQDAIIVNGSSEGEDDPVDLENNEYLNDSGDKTHFKKMISRKNAFSRRFLLMK